jgi:hypothetical protein
MHAILGRLQPFYWWPKMFETIKEELAWCQVCQEYNWMKGEQAPLLPIIPMGMFELWGLDFMGPFPESKTGHKYVLVAIEY